jgi:hypothetical protein
MYLKLDDPANADAVVDEIKHVPGMERYVVKFDGFLPVHDDADELSLPFHFLRVVMGFP